MKNPFKSFSKVNPQDKKGYRSIANDVFYALIMAGFSGPERQLIDTIISLTWGFKRLSEKITYGQFNIVTGLSRSAIIRNIVNLEEKRVIIIDRQLVAGRLPLNEYLFNKYYDTWLDQTGSALYTTEQVKLVSLVTSTGSSKWGQLVADKRPPTYKERKRKKKKRTALDEKGQALLKELGIPEPEKCSLNSEEKEAETDEDIQQKIEDSLNVEDPDDLEESTDIESF